MRSAAIRLCGSIQIELDGRAIHEQLGRGNPLMLFAYLALARGRGATRDEAAAALWSDRAPVHADAALRTVLSRLRTALGPGVLEGGSELVLRLPESATVDVVDARDAVAAAARATDASHALELARQALALTDSTFLPGCDAPWIDERRRELADLHLEATEIAAWAALELGADLPSAEAAARRLVASEPYRESGHALLMRILARRGNGAAALQAYEELRTLLRDELGTLPGPVLRGLHAQLLAEGDAPARRPVAMRRDELRRLAAALAAARETWAPLVRHDPDQRTFEQLPSPVGTEAWLICWMPGHDSGIHDHDISSGAVHVVEGELCEERVSWDGAPDAMRYGPGQSFDFGPSDVHRMSHAGTRPTVAIHVYSPPLRNQGVYSRGDRGQLQRHPLEHGAEVKPPVTAG